MLSLRQRALPVALCAAITAVVPAVGASAAAQPVTAARAPISAEAVITTIAGTGDRGFAGDGGAAVDATLNRTRDTAIGPDGSIFVVDTFNNRIRKIATDGTISTVAGDGSAGYNGDDIPATSASLHWPHDAFVDDTGVLYIADAQNHRVRMVGLDGIIHTVAGTGVAGSTGDGGPAVDAQIRNPKSVAVRGHYLYLSGLDNKIRRVDLSTGTIDTVAGTGAMGYTGDGGPAVDATLAKPQRLQVDWHGNIYVADTDNDVIRRIDGDTGTIETVAGSDRGFSGDGGPATSAELNRPRGLALAGDSLLYIADSGNDRIRAVDLSTGIITSVVGTTGGYSGDGGPAVDAQIYGPRGLTVLKNGDLLIADSMNSRIRLVSAP